MHQFLAGGVTDRNRYFSFRIPLTATEFAMSKTTTELGPKKYAENKKNKKNKSFARGDSTN